MYSIGFGDAKISEFTGRRANRFEYAEFDTMF